MSNQCFDKILENNLDEFELSYGTQQNAVQSNSSGNNLLFYDDLTTDAIKTEELSLEVHQFFVDVNDTYVHFNNIDVSAEDNKDSQIDLNSKQISESSQCLSESYDCESFDGPKTESLLNLKSVKRSRGRPKKVCSLEQRIIDIKNINKKSAKKYRRIKNIKTSQLLQKEQKLSEQNLELKANINCLETQINASKLQINQKLKLSFDSIEDKVQKHLQTNSRL